MNQKVSSGKKPDLREERERQRRRDNRETILRAAEAVVLRKGFSAASMDDVAAEAQFSKATLYRYFRNKAELVFEIVFQFIDDIDSRLKAVRARDASTRERLKDSIRTTLCILAEKENLTRAFIVDRSFMTLVQIFVSRQDRPGADAEKRFLQKIRTRRREMIKGTGEILREGVASGEFRPMDLAAAETFVGAIIQGYFVEKFWTESKVLIEDDVEPIIDFIFRGIANPSHP